MGAEVFIVTAPAAALPLPLALALALPLALALALVVTVCGEAAVIKVSARRERALPRRLPSTPRR